MRLPRGRDWEYVDTQRLKELIELMDRNQLEELEVVDGEQRVRLRKKPEKTREVVQVAAGVPAVAAAPMPAGSADPAAAEEAAPVDASSAVLSPMVGTFYRAPGPGAEPFVEIGDQVEEGQVLCIVEAMKVMNEVKAERSGVIGSSLVEDGTPVEFGQPLFSFS
jgi:acetyl-CoA carboxylase biotin carboxyl carrier protein